MSVTVAVVLAVLAALWLGIRGEAREAAAHLRRAVEDGGAPDLEALDALRPRLRTEALSEVLRVLRRDDRPTEMPPLVERLVRLDELAAAGHAAHLVGAGVEGARMIAVARMVLGRHPRQAWLRRDLAEALWRSGDPDQGLRMLEAAPGLDPELEILRARILHSASRREEALAAADRALRACGHEDLKVRAEAAQLVAALSSPDARDTARREAGTGVLAPNAWRNHGAIGREQRAAATVVVAPFAPVASTHRAFEDALSRTERHGEDPLAWCALGLEELRQDSAGRADRCFVRAVRLEPGLFPCQLGRAAALLAGEQRAWGLVRNLPEPGVDAPALAASFLDWEALTGAEQRVVAASFRPLRSWLWSAPPLVGLRILPLTARAQDVPEGETAMGWIQDLSNLDPLHGWELARALAAVAFERMTDAERMVLVEVVEQAEAAPHELRSAGLDALEGLLGELVVAWLVAEHQLGDPVVKVPAAVADWFQR